MRGGPVVQPEAASLARVRLALLSGYFMDRLDEHVEGGVMAAIEQLRSEGTSIGTATVPHASCIAPVYLHLVLADAAAYHAATLQERPAAYTPNVRLRLEMGRYILAEDYARALQGRTLLTAEIDRAFDGAEALLLPALAIPAPPLGVTVVPVKGGQEPVRNVMLRCTQPFNLSGHAAISLPCGSTPTGLPIGLQVVGRRGRTRELLSIAQAIEAALARHA
jgi:aspartyl-tRNA(Asn)/glutamyl-tRNA(Gln) amidotransferase subunit A